MTTEQPDDAIEAQPRTVRELLARIDRTRGPLERMVAELSDDELMAHSGSWEDWTPRDHLAHVAEWERRLLGEMQGDHDAANFGLDDAAIAAASTDTLNAGIYERHKNDAPETVREDFTATGDQVRTVFSALSDADLMHPVRPEDPLVDTLVDLIGWDTFKHYPHHIAAITGSA